MLQHVVEVAAAAVRGPIIVVAPAGLPLPPLGGAVVPAVDAPAGAGPLRGLAPGLAAAAAEGVGRVAVLALDLPLMRPAYLRRVLGLLEDGWDVVVPTLDGHHQPLAAAYRTSLSVTAEEVLATGDAGLRTLLERCHVRTVSSADLLQDPALAAADPHLQSTLNVNDEEDYRRALDLARGVPPGR